MSDSLGDRMKSNYENIYKLELPHRIPVIIKGFSIELTLVLCRQISTTVFAYSQSDEISLLLHNYKRLDTQPWFNNEIQKIVSVAAGIASGHFSLAYGKLATFDARAFVSPEAEVANYFIWRQKDAERNSIQMLAQSHFSHKQLYLKKIPDLHDMLHEKGINWNDLPTYKKEAFVRNSN
jgi:tRNA(His) guanylyltransferase